MTETDKKLWWQAYLAILPVSFARTHPGLCPSLSVSQMADEAVEAYHERYGADLDQVDRIVEGWGCLEVMGRQSYIGWCRDLRETPAKIVELQLLKPDGSRSSTMRFGASAVYCLTLIDEETANHMARGESLRPCKHCRKEFWSADSWYCPTCVASGRPDASDDADVWY